MKKSNTSAIPSFVGFTRFNSPHQVDYVHDDFLEITELLEDLLLFMIGVTVTRETALNLSQAEKEQHVPLKELRSFFTNERAWSLNLLNYVDCSHPGKDQTRLQLEGMVKAVEAAGPHLHVLQMNLAFPDPGAVATIAHETRKNLQLILRIGKDFSSKVEEFAEQFGEFAPHIHGVLIDPLWLEAPGYDQKQLPEIVGLIHKAHPHLRIAVRYNGEIDNRQLAYKRLKQFKVLCFESSSAVNPAQAKVLMQQVVRLYDTKARTSK